MKTFRIYYRRLRDQGDFADDVTGRTAQDAARFLTYLAAAGGDPIEVVRITRNDIPTTREA